MQNFESLVAAAEERAKHLDVTVRSKSQIAEVSQTIQVSNMLSSYCVTVCVCVCVFQLHVTKRSFF